MPELLYYAVISTYRSHKKAKIKRERRQQSYFSVTFAKVENVKPQTRLGNIISSYLPVLPSLMRSDFPFRKTVTPPILIKKTLFSMGCTEAKSNHDLYANNKVLCVKAV